MPPRPLGLVYPKMIQMEQCHTETHIIMSLLNKLH